MARILYIDDQVASQKLIEALLKQAGHQVTLADDGMDGIEKMQIQSFDLVITDAVMPGGVSGYDVTKTIRRSFGPDKLPIILLTGRRERRDVEKAIEAGVSDYIVKPVDPAGFAAKITAALRTVAPRDPAAPIEIQISEVARMQTSLNVTGISERGLAMRSSQPFRIGADVDLGEDFFKKLGLDIKPTLKVVTCEPLPAGQFRLQVAFTDVGEAGLRALRLWISFNHSRKSA